MLTKTAKRKRQLFDTAAASAPSLAAPFISNTYENILKRLNSASQTFKNPFQEKE